MAVSEIPLLAQPQTFGITLGGVTYQMTVLWRAEPMNSWVLDIADANSVPIVSGIPLVTGADLLGQLAYLGIGHMVVQTDHAVDDVPTYSNLGGASHLYFVS